MTDPEIKTNLGFESRNPGAVSLKDPQMPGENGDFGKKLRDSQSKIEEKRDEDDILSFLSGLAPAGQAGPLLSMGLNGNKDKELNSGSFKGSGLLGSKPLSSSERSSSDMQDNNKGGLSGSGRDAGAKASTAGKAVEELRKMVSENRTALLNANLIPLSELSKNISRFTSRIDLQGVIDRIIESARLLKAGEKTAFSIELKPEWLGNMTLNISSEKGVLNVQIFAGESAKVLLDSGLQELQDSLKAANLNIGSLSVSVDSRRNDQPHRGEEADKTELLSSLPSFGITEREALVPGLEAYYFQMALGMKRAKSNIFKEI